MEEHGEASAGLENNIHAYQTSSPMELRLTYDVRSSGSA